MSAFCLALHATYRCQHAGACCSADWLIPAEPHVIRFVESRHIRPAGVTGPLFVEECVTEQLGADAVGADAAGSDPGSPGSHKRSLGSDPVGADDMGADPVAADPVVARRPDGTCVFFERHAGCLCAIHRDAGVQALPSACRHFPREILIDARGSLISLSHFCPTAAALLFTSASLDVVEASPPLRLDDPVEGMDATNALAPLVRPGLLSDLDGYDAWERACLATFARPYYTAQQALDLVTAATEEVRDWRPGAGALATHVRDAFRHTTPVPFHPFTGFADLCARHFPPAAGPVPDFDHVWDGLVEPSLGPFESAIRNYLAARLFGNWMAYQGRGLRSIVEWLRTALAVFRNELARRCTASGARPTRTDVVEAIRATDLLLLHTIDSETLARDFASLEGPEPA